MRALLLAATLAAAGCYSEEPTPVYATAGSPDLVAVGPGVDVIADYDYPVFYSDGWWWRYDGGIWYQSGYYNRGWNVAYNVPIGVRGIHNPGAYSHWHNGPIVRDHRMTGYSAYRGGSGYRGSYGYRAAPAYRGSVGARPAPVMRGGGGGGFHGGGGGGHHR